MDYRTKEELLAGLDALRSSPLDNGTLALIVRRPSEGEREALDAGELNRHDGLVGDGWRPRASTTALDGSAEVARQITIMNARAIVLFAGDDRDRWAHAGDQLYLDLNLSDENLPPGARIRLGGAVLEISAEAHTGCAKFVARFGRDVTRFINSPEGKRLHLRGIYARVIEPGTVRVGDIATKVSPPPGVG
ncbi:MAG: MOSC domain-containing protein [Acidimicrobiales bacterium]